LGARWRGCYEVKLRRLLGHFGDKGGFIGFTGLQAEEIGFNFFQFF